MRVHYRHTQNQPDHGKGSVTAPPCCRIAGAGVAVPSSPADNLGGALCQAGHGTASQLAVMSRRSMSRGCRVGKTWENVVGMHEAARRVLAASAAIPRCTCSLC